MNSQKTENHVSGHKTNCQFCVLGENCFVLVIFHKSVFYTQAICMRQQTSGEVAVVLLLNFATEEP